MDQTRAENLLRWYESIEHKLEMFLRDVPPQGQNFNTWSPLLADVIVDSCSLIDSLFRHISPAKIEISGTAKSRGKLTISDYAVLYGTSLGLAQRKIICLLTPPEYREPFSSWASPSSSLDWWKVHTDLKHDRIVNLDKAVLNVGIDALAGAFAALSSSHSLIRALLRRGWTNLGGYNPDLSAEIETQGYRNMQRSMSFSIETTLFATVHGEEPLPDDIRDFCPTVYRGSARLVGFFGNW